MLRTTCNKLPLTSLLLYRAQFSGADYEQYTHTAYELHRAEVAAILTAYREALVQLAAPCAAVKDYPPHVLSNLTYFHLQYEMEDTTDGFHFMCESCSQLQSLKITCFRPVGFLAAVGENPAALPRLPYLKIWTFEGLNTAQRDGLIIFVESKKRLRCFDYSDDCSSNAQTIVPLLSALRSLPTLRVMGIDVAIGNEGVFRTFIDHIPRHVTALRLSIEYRGGDAHQPDTLLSGLVSSSHL